MNIHSTAIVSQKADIAEDVSVGPYSIIDDYVTIGKGTKIGSHCVITGHTTIGQDCEIFTGSILGSKPQDMKFKGEKHIFKSAAIIQSENIVFSTQGQGMVVRPL